MGIHREDLGEQRATGRQPERTIDKYRLDQYMLQLRGNQNLGLGVLGGIIGGAIGAALWAVITVLTNFQIGWMAVGVGFLVGYGVRLFGRGVDTSFGVVGAALALLGCFAGNLLTVVIVLSREEHMPFLDLLFRLDPRIALELMKATFEPIDLLFYGIAIYEGYRLSIKQLTQEELARLAQ